MQVEGTTVEEILADARAIPSARPYITLVDYGEAIYIMLYEKNMTYREIREWFDYRGISYSKSAFPAAVKKWKALNPSQVKK